MERGFVSLRTLFYLLYAVVLTATLLYLRFPTEKFKVFCEKRAESFLPGSECSIGRIAYRPPFAVVFTGIQLQREVEGRRSTLRLERLAVAPKASSLFRNFSLDGLFYKGKFSMRLAVDSRKERFDLSDVSLTGMSIDEWAADYNLFERQVSGTVSISGSYQAGMDAPLEGTGKGELTAVDGSFELLQPILSLKSLSFDRLTIDMSQEKEMLKFVKGELAGREITADFTGEMRVASPLPASIVLLSGKLVPKENFLAGHPEERRLVEQLLRRYKMSALPFKVGGTARIPTFRFSL